MTDCEGDLNVDQHFQSITHLRTACNETLFYGEVMNFGVLSNADTIRCLNFYFL